MTPLDYICWSSLITLTIVSWIMCLIMLEKINDLKDQISVFKSRWEREETYRIQEAQAKEEYRIKYKEIKDLWDTQQKS